MTDYNELRRAAELAAYDQAEARLRDATTLLAQAREDLVESEAVRSKVDRTLRLLNLIVAYHALTALVAIFTSFTYSSLPLALQTAVFTTQLLVMIRLIVLRREYCFLDRRCGDRVRAANQLIDELDYPV